MPSGHFGIHFLVCRFAYKSGDEGQTATQLPLELSAYVGGDGGQRLTHE